MLWKWVQKKPTLIPGHSIARYHFSTKQAMCLISAAMMSWVWWWVELVVYKQIQSFVFYMQKIAKSFSKFLFIPILLKFIYSEKATQFCKISTLLLSYVVPVKIKVDISKNCAAFSEYMNFNYL